MAILYQKGTAHEDGKIIIEDLNLINNVKYWYYVGGALSTIIIAPYIIELILLVIFLKMKMRNIINMIVQIMKTGMITKNTSKKE